MAKLAEQRQLVHMRIEADLLRRVDDFRFKHRFQTRTEAARWLLKAALDAKLTPKGE